MDRLLLVFVVVISLLLSSSDASADWPMAGHDNQRTSYSSESFSLPAGSCGYHAFDSYIPSKTQIITANLGSIDLVYVPTAKGVYALKSSDMSNSESDVVWFYPTSRPVGHSPTVEKSTGIIYISSLDKTLHAVNAATGQSIWQSDKAGGSFVTSPLVANNKVYVGNRDGYFYAFNAASGDLEWYFRTDGPIEYSAAISADNSTIYFASNDMHAYALNAQTGALVGKSIKFQGRGFTSFWPVYYSQSGQNTRVLFPKAPNYPENALGFDQQEAQLATDSNPVPISTFVAYHDKYPDRETLLVLDPNSLVKRETSPLLWWGNATGNRYPPAITPDGKIWDLQNWRNTDTSPFGKGGFVSWRIGDSSMPHAGNPMLESGDEPRAFVLLGNYIAFGHGGDGADTFGFTHINTSSSRQWSNAAIFNTWGKWYEYWNRFSYGNWLNFFYNTDTNTVRWWTNSYGTHGNQSPVTPLNGRGYIHRSNSVLCVQ